MIDKVLEWAWAGVGALASVAWRMLTGRLDALEKHVAEVDERQTSEMNRQRDNISKLFDKLEQHAQRSEDRHRELLTALHAGLAGKADR